MLYRIHLDVLTASGGSYKKGTISSLSDVSANGKEALLASGTISEVSSPPLSILPGWEDRAETLGEYNINDVVDLVETDLEELSDRTGIPHEALRKGVEEALEFVK